jgi:hypothetical protein
VTDWQITQAAGSWELASILLVVDLAILKNQIVHLQDDGASHANSGEKIAGNAGRHFRFSSRTIVKRDRNFTRAKRPVSRTG